MNKMYSNQDVLPKLPVPDLQTTVSEFLKWVKPIVSEMEFRECQIKADAFIQNEGPVLQEKLMQWDKSLVGSWLKPFWDESYLEFRKPVAPNMNYFALLEKEGLEGLKYTELAGHFIYHTARVFLEMAEGEMLPETIKGRPLCMDQYRRTVCTTRIPQKKIDVISTGELNKTNSHVVLLYRGNVYKVMVSNSAGHLYTPEALSNLVEDIVAEDTKVGEGVGLFTTADRDDAAMFYQALQMEPMNKANLRVIEEAIVVVCLDDEKVSESDMIKNLMISSANNRYFDKGCQIIINKNGHIGFNNEHTGADGTTWFTLFEKIHDGVVRNIREDKHAQPVDLCASKLQWELAESVIQRLLEMKEAHQQNEEAYYVDASTFDSFGKQEIKKLGVSPDAYFHVALQLAQYKLFGKLNSTYEPVAVRYFKEGRTECNRPCTKEVLELAKAYTNPNTKQSTLKELAEKACQAHVARIKKCQAGQGVERHLLGLSLMQQKFGVEIGVTQQPDLFKTDAYKMLKHDRLSTSGLGYEYVKAFGFGPVVQDGFGIGYGIRNMIITTCVSSRVEHKEMLEKLMKYFYEMLNSLRTILAGELK